MSRRVESSAPREDLDQAWERARDARDLRVMQLRDGGFSFAEIARQMGLTPAEVRGIVSGITNDID